MGAQRVELEIFRIDLGNPARFYIKSANIYTLTTDTDLTAGMPICNKLSTDSTPKSWRRLRKEALRMYNVKLPLFAACIHWERHTFYYNTSIGKFAQDM